MRYQRRVWQVEAWRNIVGQDIPPWLQGRGSGGSGNSLNIFDHKNELIWIQPGHWAVLGPYGEISSLDPETFHKEYDHARRD